MLDNARETDQIRPLLPGSPGCLAVVTSRNDLSSLIVAYDANTITLDLLTSTEAQELLARRLGQDRIAAEPEAVAEIIRSCARLSLALAIVAARAATHPHFSLHTLAAEFSARLDAFTGTDVRACSPGPIGNSARERKGCSGCSAYTPAPTSPHRPRPA